MPTLVVFAHTGTRYVHREFMWFCSRVEKEINSQLIVKEKGNTAYGA